MKLIMLVIVSSLVITGCSSTGGGNVGTGVGADYTPVVDTKGVGQKKYNIDLMECRALAQQVENNRKNEIIGKAIAGAVAGAIIGSSQGDRGRNAGAKTGLLAGAGVGADNAYSGAKGVIKKCLQGRGYSVLD